MESIKRNKVIIAICVVLLVGVFFFGMIFAGHKSSELRFNPLNRPDTGEPMTAVGSIVALTFIASLAVGVIGSVIAFFTEVIYSVLHIRDKKLFDRFDPPPHQDEFDFGIGLSFKLTFVAVFILVVFQLSNFITFD